MDPIGIWDAAAASNYDTPGTGMFAPEVLGPTVRTLHHLAAGGRALEFAIGTGRVALPLADTGIAVTGIEASGAMLDVLRQKPGAERIRLIQGDMASASAPGPFSLVYLVYNTIANLLTQTEQVACFRNAARHLRPGGCFVVELGVPQLRQLPPGVPGHVFAARPGYLGVDNYDVSTQQMVSHHVTFGDGPDARIFRTPHRYIWPSELDLMGELAGLVLESRNEDWGGSAFTADSRSHVSVYRLLQS
jgi:SAM-dependent methyltransferase